MESIARISSLLENARELTLDAASAARSSRSSSKPLDRTQIKKLLDSRNEREVLDGLRRAISMMYRSQKTLPLFSSVVKNVASPNLEIKKLVYIFLIHHAEQEPDVALLSINTIQKSLSDTNPQVRALALRTMSAIRVPVISQIVSLAIRKGAGDMSPYVRRAAALAIPKCYRLDPSQLPQLLEYLSTLLGDKQYYVAGAAVTAFLEVCSERIDMIHKHYRNLVKVIVDMDEWSQLSTLRLMTFYARKCFPRRTRLGKSKEKDVDEFYGEATKFGSEGDEVVILDSDLELLLNSIRPLLQSRNSAVVVAVARCYSAVGTPAYVQSAVGPLIALLRGAQDTEQIALYNIVSICLNYPANFVKYATHFLVRATDTQPVWELKLELLTLIFPHAPPHVKSLILNELEHFSRGSDRGLIKEAVRAIGRCAQTDTATAPRCLRLLLDQITSLDGTLAAESLTVIRHLIQQDPTAHVATVVRLAKNLDSATDPQARATIIWLVGEFSGINGKDNIAADVLRILLKDFPSESEVAKRQIVLLGAKVYLHYLNRQMEEASYSTSILPPAGPKLAEDDDHPTAKLWTYVMLLARYDTSYDLRDRARLYKSLLAVPQLATLMLLAPKPAPHAPSPSETRKGFTLGSAALVLAGGGGIHGLRGYEDLPEWVEKGQEPDSRLRDREGDENYGGRGSVPTPAADRIVDFSGAGRTSSVSPASGVSSSRERAGSANGVGAKTLDDWLAEDEGLDEKKAVAQEESEEEEEEEESEEEEDDDEEEESEEDEEEEEESEEESDEDARLVKS
ncbi:adaptin N terminal region-domain-containing protein [Podospora fimiseda]|uniref:Adaptin N terminal region-domain-containing protein n=1 Tax=Podospora fimiseda TaxID=252190 RepID=A0AAN7BVJ9_9PEZI|nr:adaptin N terminal region-domain-containing protein [Podospora fimiseda]